VKAVAALLADEAGQGLAEYALILGLIAVVCLVAVVAIGTDIQATLHKLSTVI
jgi:Flp pilus assembly pilin Flp